MKEGVRGERRLQLTLVTELIGQPVQSLIEPVPTGDTGDLNVPVPLVQKVQAQLVRDLGHVHGIEAVLLVCKHEQGSIPELVLHQYPHELHWGLLHALSDTIVNHKDETLCALEVVAPQMLDLVLTAHVPHGEADVLVLQSFHIETYGGDGGQDLTQH